tara:strand:+ start:282 stop:434 length:153 start_codon:yes stop_codon:yes gene_type:complete
MPIWLRNFTFNQIKDYYEKENERSEKQNQEIKRISSKSKIPNYKVKAPTK